MSHKKVLGVVVGVLTALVVGLSVVSAHVTVGPKESTVGAFEKYTVRVPSEKPVPTVKVEVELPAGVTFSRVAPKTGWKYELRKDATGRVTGVIWSGGSIGPEEFDEFYFQARNPREPVKLAWRTFQTYGDGSVVEWTGPEGSQFPASVTEIKVAESAGDASHDGSGSTVSVQPSARPGPSDSGLSTADPGIALPLASAASGLAVAALLLSLVALRRRG